MENVCVTGERSERKKFFVFLSIQLFSALLKKKKKKNAHSDTKVAVLLYVLQPRHGQASRGQRIAPSNIGRFDFNRARSILNAIKDTPIP